MKEFSFTVTVESSTREEAEQVMRERIYFDEDYGFDYQIWIEEAIPPNSTPKVRPARITSIR